MCGGKQSDLQRKICAYPSNKACQMRLEWGYKSGLQLMRMFCWVANGFLCGGLHNCCYDSVTSIPTSIWLSSFRQNEKQEFNKPQGTYALKTFAARSLKPVKAAILWSLEARLQLRQRLDLQEGLPQAWRVLYGRAYVRLGRFRGRCSFESLHLGVRFC